MRGKTHKKKSKIKVKTEKKKSNSKYQQKLQFL